MVSGKELLLMLERTYYFWPALLVFLSLYYLISYQYTLWRISATLGWIQKPPSLLFLGNTFCFAGKSPTDRWRKSMELLETYGGMVQLWMTQRPTVLVSKKHVVEKLLKGTGDTLTIKSEHYSFMGDILGKGLINISAMDWMKRRKLLDPFFQEGDASRCALTTHLHAKALVTFLSEKVTSSEVIDIQHYMRLSSADLASDVLMMSSPNFLQHSEQLYLNAIKTVGEVVSCRTRTPLYNWKPIYLLTLTRALQARSSATINSFTQKAINRRRKTRQSNEVQNQTDQGKTTFLDYLLDIEDKQLINEKGVQNEMNTFMFAAEETVGAGIAFTLYLLGLHSDIQEKVSKEVKEAITEDKLDIGRLELLERCIKESLRLYPPMPWIGRYLKNYIRIEGDKMLPEGASVLINSFKLHRDPDIFTRPEEFDPERPEPPEFAYLPFGAGWRSCIGQNWAIIQMKIMLAYILNHYSVSSLDKPENLKLEANLVLRSANGLRVRFSKRQ